MTVSIGFIGAGMMAEAIISGMLKAGTVDVSHILVTDINSSRLSYITDTYCVTPCTDQAKLVEQCKVVILAVKPAVIGEVMASVGERLSAEHIVISLAAGISLKFLTNFVRQDVAVARVMPNTPCLIGKGVSCVTFSPGTTKEKQALAVDILASVGTVHVLPETLMNAVTGLSGSGPAYVYLMIEALSDAGVKNGLPRDIAQDLAIQTMIGAAAMVAETKTHPAVLKEKVTTPGGTTIAGLHMLEQAGVRAGLINAVSAATQRAAELGKD